MIRFLNFYMVELQKAEKLVIAIAIAISASMDVEYQKICRYYVMSYVVNIRNALSWRPDIKIHLIGYVTYPMSPF